MRLKPSRRPTFGPPEVRKTSGPPVQPLIEHWDGSAWSVVPSPSLSRARPTVQPLGGFLRRYLGDRPVSNRGNTQTLAVHWDGSDWTVIPSPNPGPYTNNFVYDVEAVSASDVWAVGVSADPTPDFRLRVSSCIGTASNGRRYRFRLRRHTTS